MSYTITNHLRDQSVIGFGALERAFRAGALARAYAGAATLPRLPAMSTAAFAQDVRGAQRPVVVSGMFEHWPARTGWSFESLARRFGETRVTVDLYSQRRRDMTFAQYVDLISQPLPECASPSYLQEWYFQLSRPELADDMPELEITQYDFRRKLYGKGVAENHQLWIGQKGSVTPLHQDGLMVDALHAQIVGRKRWFLMGPKARLHLDASGQPDFDRLVADPDTELMTCVLEPGDLLFLPANWWHRIDLLTDSIGLGRKCLDERNLERHIRQRMAELLPLALNLDELMRNDPQYVSSVLLRNQSMAKHMGINLTSLRAEV